MSDTTVRKVDSVPASGAAGTPLLQIRDLKMHFPIKEAAGLSRTKKVVQAVDGVSFDAEGGRQPRPGRRVRLWQVDHRPDDHPAADPDVGADPVQGHRHRAAEGEGPAPVPPGAADRLPGPVQLAEPAADGQQHHQYAAARAQPGEEGQGGRAGPGAAGAGRPEPRAPQPLPERVLRRSAPAHRHRPGARGGARGDHRRRAGVRAGRVHPGPGDEPAGGPAPRPRHRVRLHRPRPRRGPALL